MSDEPSIDSRELDIRARETDTTPLMALVRDQPYSRGKLTSEGRTASDQYRRFLERNRHERQ